MKKPFIYRNDEDQLCCSACHAVVFRDGVGGGAILCECQKHAIEQRTLQSGSGVEKRFESITLEGLISKSKGQNAALDMARGFVRTWPESKGFYFYGPSGTGKTFIATAALNDVQSKYFALAANWKIAEVLADLCNAEFSDREIEMQERLKIVESAHLLMLDDLGAELATDASIKMLERFIGKRDEVQKPLIVTSNCNPDELQNKVGHRAASRILGLCYPVPVIGEDLRRKMARKAAA